MENEIPTELSQLHCGACDRNFDDMEDLNEHLKICPVARCLLPLIYLTFNGADKMGHPMSRFVQNVKAHQSCVINYAYAVADKMDNFRRSKLHSIMCEKLDLDYNKFRPFEDSSIISSLNREEALNHLWDSLCQYVISTSCKRKV